MAFNVEDHFYVPKLSRWQCGRLMPINLALFQHAVWRVIMSLKKAATLKNQMSCFFVKQWSFIEGYFYFSSYIFFKALACFFVREILLAQGLVCFSTCTPCERFCYTAMIIVQCVNVGICALWTLTFEIETLNYCIKPAKRNVLCSLWNGDGIMLVKCRPPIARLACSSEP